MTPGWLILFYSALIICASIAGGSLSSRVRLDHFRMQLILSFVGGFMLGVALLHLIPHGVAASGSLDLVVGWTLIGLLFTFFMIRTFHFHEHGPTTLEDDLDDASHDHHVHGGHGGGQKMSWTGVALGLSVHTLIDGVALGAAVKSDAAMHGIEHQHGMLCGFGVFLAIFLHKPLDALSITSLMTATGWSRSACRLVNAGFALMCPLGAGLVLLGMHPSNPGHEALLGIALGFSAGVFLCISLSDLLPEVQFHQHDRGKLSAALLTGVAIAYAIGAIEPGHLHDHGQPSAVEAIPGHEH